MKRRRLAALAVGALAPLAALGSAAATSPAVTPVVHVAGADLDDLVQVNADNVKFQTKVPTDVSVVTLTLDPNATTGWHSHPGLAVIAVAEGTGKLYSADCSARTYSAGEAFVEDGDDTPTVFRNESASSVVLTVTFIAPQGSPLLHGEADPGCGLS